MELSGDELNSKLLQEKDQSTKEEREQKPTKQTDDLLRIITGSIRLPTIEKGLVRDPDCYSPRGQGHISVQNLQPIDVAPTTNRHETNSVSKEGWENTSAGFGSTILEHHRANATAT